MSTRHLVGFIAATFALTACGMSETAAVTAAQAENAVEQAKEGEKTKARIEEDIAAAQQQAQEARDAAEAN
jgi:hypothetical protein